VRVVAEKEQTFQSVGFEQDLARHAFPLGSQRIDQTINGHHNVPVYLLIEASCVDILPDSLGE
jgi:hypothetical protein